jgi:multidrug efflux pump subunit AcrB
VFFGHLLHGMPISVLSGFGVVALIGVLVNDALVFITSFNLRLKNGDKFSKALEETALNRFRPIVLTTITTVFGLLPLIFEKSMQAQFLIPMAISLSYGIIMATLLTLLLLPVMLLTVNNIRLFLSKSANREDVEPACKELKNHL